MWNIAIIGRSGPLADQCVIQLGASHPTTLPLDAARRTIADCRAIPPDLMLLVCGEGTWDAALREQLSAVAPGRPVLAVLPEGADDTLIRAAIAGADDFLIGRGADELRQRTLRLLRAHHGEPLQPFDPSKERLLREMALLGLIGRDSAFIQTLGKLPLLARSNGPLLLTGETGTGKELFARAIHCFGRRADHPFITVDCTVLPDHLFENEVFGHVAGAFTDARRDQKGLVALAEGGTLFLDEVNSLSVSSQGKLLRLLQDRTYRPLGGTAIKRMNVTVIAATNADLLAQVKANAFRADLYYRLSGLQLSLPPLRQRRGDIALLARHLLREVCAEAGLPARVLSPGALARLEAGDWPGNVRELRNVVQNAAMLAECAEIGEADLRDGVSTADEPSTPVAPYRVARSAALARFEQGYLESLLTSCGGNISRAARLAGKERRAFGRLVKRHRGEVADLPADGLGRF